MPGSISPPKSEAELMQRAVSLAGSSLEDLAKQLNIPIPENLKKTKGWVGELIEVALGATASTLPEPDFQAIGIELKTIPVQINGQPKESTFVCTAPLANTSGLTWQDSTVKKKLNRVLWLPIESDPEIALGKRRIGQAILWSPSREQESKLRSDWQEIIERITLGQLETISTSLGDFLQLRPKAANAKSLRIGIDAEGNKMLTLPRGFYLRSQFTKQILQQHYHPQS